MLPNGQTVLLVMILQSTYWASFWCRLPQIDGERWKELLLHMPNLPELLHAVFPPITVAQIRRRHAQRLKPSAAVGLDGVSRLDIVHAPDAFLQGLTSFYAAAESTGHWPLQVVQSKIISIAKTDNPVSPQHTRPIQIFSIVYRVWSSLRARQALKALAPYLPPAVAGVPGRGTEAVT